MSDYPSLQELYEAERDVIEADARRLESDYEQLLKLHRACQHKFGKAPDISKLIGKDEDGGGQVS
jgi:hypothetical protein